MSTALYRRYRPEAFDEVIGQEHVTRPLSAAIDAGRINHAFLFSGPRGCGKTTSARILARCLNCAEGPTSNPCGQCPSCQDLANGGAGSLDVVEIDAASHNGVDDARDLRERAVYAPARDRYKVFILDEAHMVTTQGFNALLKLVEEPPAHVKFVFATTEPDKVIQTIRSRTHHYPFRLVPPETLVRYLDDLSGRENVNVGKGVLPLVVRAGGGSVRDTLSVLDQLMAGAGAEGVDYATAVALLGYTDDSLLGDIVDSFSAGDGAGVFRVIDRVVESGHDPRRFVEDLLERFRDLFVISAAEDAAASFLPEVPADRLERLKVQARAFGPGELSRAADLLNVGLTEMTGATSPRLQLELICARILLPGAENSRRSVVSRVDRLERRIGMSAGGRMPAGAVPVQAAAEPGGPEAAGPEPAGTEPAGPEPAGTDLAGTGRTGAEQPGAQQTGAQQTGTGRTEHAGAEAAPGSRAARSQESPAGQSRAAGAAASAEQDADPFAGMAAAMASARSVLDGGPEEAPRVAPKDRSHAAPDDRPRSAPEDTQRAAPASAPAEPSRADQQPDPRPAQMRQAEPQQPQQPQ
ncbi:MAG: DNA polymerase III subunit gamma and tau, partial [Brevibacterium yomogidense]